MTTTPLFRTYPFLYSAKGNENATTPPSPVRVYVPGSVDLDETDTFCASSDNDMLVTCRVYSVQDVTLPAWLDPADWAADTTTWKWAWGCGVDPTWPESWQRGLSKLSASQKIAACKLLRTKTFRNAFRAAMRDKIVAWLETAPSERAHSSPLSFRQWECVIDVHILREARRLDETLYRARFVVGVPKYLLEKVA